MWTWAGDALWDDFYKDVPVAERPLDQRVAELPKEEWLLEHSWEQRNLGSVEWGV